MELSRITISIVIGFGFFCGCFAIACLGCACLSTVLRIITTADRGKSAYRVLVDEARRSILAIILASFALLPAMFEPSGSVFSTPLSQFSAENKCIDNLRQIDCAKQQWANDNNKSADAIPTAEDIYPYLKRDVRCPFNGR